MLRSAGVPEKKCSPTATEMAPSSPGMGVNGREGDLAKGRRPPHQEPPYLLGYVFKFISCQFTLESQPENVHAALIMTMTATITFMFSPLLVQVHFHQPCGVGLIIAISQTRKVEVWRDDIR